MILFVERVIPSIALALKMQNYRLKIQDSNANNYQDITMNPDTTPDHDLLIEIKTELKLFRDEARTTNDDTKERLIKLGENKVEKDAFMTFLAGDSAYKADHETRVRRLEMWGLMAIGGLFIIQLVIGWYLIIKPPHV